MKIALQVILLLMAVGARAELGDTYQCKVSRLDYPLSHRRATLLRTVSLTPGQNLYSEIHQIGTGFRAPNTVTYFLDTQGINNPGKVSIVIWKASYSDKVAYSLHRDAIGFDDVENSINIECVRQ